MNTAANIVVDVDGPPPLYAYIPVDPFKPSLTFSLNNFLPSRLRPDASEDQEVGQSSLHSPPQNLRPASRNDAYGPAHARTFRTDRYGPSASFVHLPANSEVQSHYPLRVFPEEADTAGYPVHTRRASRNVDGGLTSTMRVPGLGYELVGKSPPYRRERSRERAEGRGAGVRPPPSWYRPNRRTEGRDISRSLSPRSRQATGWNDSSAEEPVIPVADVKRDAPPHVKDARNSQTNLEPWRLGERLDRDRHQVEARRPQEAIDDDFAENLFLPSRTSAEPYELAVQSAEFDQLPLSLSLDELNSQSPPHNLTENAPGQVTSAPVVVQSPTSSAYITQRRTSQSNNYRSPPDLPPVFVPASRPDLSTYLQADHARPTSFPDLDMDSPNFRLKRRRLVWGPTSVDNVVDAQPDIPPAKSSQTEPSLLSTDDERDRPIDDQPSKLVSQATTPIQPRNSLGESRHGEVFTQEPPEATEQLTLDVVSQPEPLYKRLDESEVVSQNFRKFRLAPPSDVVDLDNLPSPDSSQLPSSVVLPNSVPQPSESGPVVITPSSPAKLHQHMTPEIPTSLTRLPPKGSKNRRLSVALSDHFQSRSRSRVSSPLNDHSQHFLPSPPPLGDHYQHFLSSHHYDDLPLVPRFHTPSPLTPDQEDQIESIDSQHRGRSTSPRPLGHLHVATQQHHSAGQPILNVAPTPPPRGQSVSSSHQSVHNYVSAESKATTSYRNHVGFNARVHSEYAAPQQVTVAASTHVYILAFLFDTVPRQIYLHMLLRLPYLYFSRVTRIFEEAEMSMPMIKQGILDAARAKAELGYDIGMAVGTRTGREGEKGMMSRPNLPLEYWEPPSESVAYMNLQNTWQAFIDSLQKEWKTLNIISVLLLSAILTVLQIPSAAADPVTRYSALLSMICALMSLLYGCIYIIRFGTMRKTYKGAEWAEEAQKSRTSIFWNIWVLLAMPAAWLAWSMILYVVTIMSFVWRTTPVSAPNAASESLAQVLIPRLIISLVLVFGIVYFVLIAATLRRYGEMMDRAWQRRIWGWMRDSLTEGPKEGEDVEKGRGYEGMIAAGGVTEGSKMPEGSSQNQPLSRQHSQQKDEGRLRNLAGDISDLRKPAYGIEKEVYTHKFAAIRANPTSKTFDENELKPSALGNMASAQLSHTVLSVPMTDAGAALFHSTAGPTASSPMGGLRNQKERGVVEAHIDDADDKAGDQLTHLASAMMITEVSNKRTRRERWSEAFLASSLLPPEAHASPSGAPSVRRSSGSFGAIEVDGTNSVKLTKLFKLSLPDLFGDSASALGLDQSLDLKEVSAEEWDSFKRDILSIWSSTVSFEHENSLYPIIDTFNANLRSLNVNGQVAICREFDDLGSGYAIYYFSGHDPWQDPLDISPALERITKACSIPRELQKLDILVMNMSQGKVADSRTTLIPLLRRNTEMAEATGVKVQ